MRLAYLGVRVERSMHPDWLSNAYLVAAEDGASAVFVDSGAPLGPLHDVVARERLDVTHLLVTHSHADHVSGHDELLSSYSLAVATGAVETGGLRVEALPTPGHADDHVAFVVNGEVCLSGDILFRDAVGGGPDAEPIRRSVMDALMALPAETRVLPGHTEETTVGREWEENPFVRYWRGEAGSLDEPVRVAGREATLVVWSPDYDGKGKALVRFRDGRDAIVGGSRVTRTGH